MSQLVAIFTRTVYKHGTADQLSVSGTEQFALVLGEDIELQTATSQLNTLLSELSKLAVQFRRGDFVPVDRWTFDLVPVQLPMAAYGMVDQPPVADAQAPLKHDVAPVKPNRAARRKAAH